MQSTTPVEDSELARIAQEISVQALRCIAVKDLELTQVDLENMEEKNRADKNAFSLDILISWRNRHPEEEAREVRTFIIADRGTRGHIISVKRDEEVMIAKINRQQGV